MMGCEVLVESWLVEFPEEDVLLVEASWSVVIVGVSAVGDE